jgi:hypothetical protein
MPILGNQDAVGANRLGLITFQSSDNTVGIQCRTGVVLKPLLGPLSNNHGDRVHPMLVIYNRTAGEMWGFSDLGVMMTGGVPAMASAASRGFGTVSSAAAPSASCVYLAAASGSIVEAIATVSGAGDFLTRLGWNVHWKTCPVDSGSIKLPYLVNHWQQLGLTPWTATWNFQEEKTNPLSFNAWDGYNINGWTLTTQLVNSYRYRIPSWNRAGLLFPRTNDARSLVFSQVPPQHLMFDPTGSFAGLLYAQLSGSAASDSILGMSATTSASPFSQCWVSLSAGKTSITSAGASATGTVQYNANDRVHPWLLVYDKTNSRVKVYTDMEALTGTYNAITNTGVSGNFGFGGLPGPRLACSGVYMYGAFCTGTLAESLSTDGVASSFLKSLGWNVPW